MFNTKSGSDKLYAAISADIVASTSLSVEDWKKLRHVIINALIMLADRYVGFWGRLVKGDTIECVMENPQDALRIALMLKTLVKSFVPSDDIATDKFKRQGLRMAIGIGKMRIVDKGDDVMDGEAIYLSGRALAKMRKKPIDSFQVLIGQDRDIGGVPIIASLLNHLINIATSRQCETLFYRLQYERDIDVAKIMKITRAGVNNNLRSIGWVVIEGSLDFFENFVYNNIR